MGCSVIVDSREYSSAAEVIKWLKRLGCTVVPRHLDYGDYVLHNGVGIERKSSHDLISSIVDGRLFDQLRGLREAYGRAVLVVEGDLWGAVEARGIHRHSVLGALAAVPNMGVSLVQTPDEEGTAYLIYSLSRAGRVAARPAGVVKGKSLREVQLQFLSSLPGIGPRRAERILRTFGTPINALNSLGQWTRRVDGINERVVAMVKRVLTTPFEGGEGGGNLTIDEALGGGGVGP